MLPPNAPAEAIMTLRQAVVALSKDSDFIGDAMRTMRFHPRFEVGEQGEKLFQRVAQTPPEVVTFIRQYIEEVNK
jgi:hypothetical protein